MAIGGALASCYPKGFGSRGRKFKSCHPDQYLQGATFPGSLFSFVLRSSSGPDHISNLQFDVSGM